MTRIKKQGLAVIHAVSQIPRNTTAMFRDCGKLGHVRQRTQTVNTKGIKAKIRITYDLCTHFAILTAQAF